MRQILSIFGIPISNTTEKEEIEEIVALIEKFPEERQSQFVTEAAASVLIHGYRWNFGRVRYEELFHVYRSAAIVTTDSFSIKILCFLLGYPLKNRFHTRDLILSLGEVLGEKGKSLFILSDDTMSTQQLTKKIWDRCPGLEIVGTLSTDIPTSGTALSKSQTIDQLVLEQIHNAHPDLLYIDMESPKSEIWFERVHSSLQVPVAVNIAKPGREGFLNKWVKRAIGGIKFSLLATPLVIYNTISSLRYRIICQKTSNQVDKTLLFFSKEKSIAVIKLPPLINDVAGFHLSDQIEEAFHQDIVILDFQKVHHIDLRGVGLLLSTWLLSREKKKELYGTNMKGDIKFLLGLYQIWNLLADGICEDPKAILSRLCREETKSVLYESIRQELSYVILTFFGQLDNHKHYRQYLEQLEPIIHKKNCLLDFSYCTYIDSTGIAFLLQLQEVMQKQKKQMKICNLSPSVKEALRLARLLDQFLIYRDEASALNLV